jgi:serine/threonine protein kinase
MDVSHGGRIRVVGTAAGTGAPAVMISATRMGEMFTLLQLQQATDNFSPSNLLANGHSGDLFKGVLEGGTRVVVKRIDLQKMKSMDSYLQELDVLARASHTRLVLLLGTCCCLDSNNSNSNNSSSNEKFLVYKFAPNGDLESALQKKNTFIFPEAVSNAAMQSDSGVQSLDWITRLKIAIGVAEALAYLHFECSPPIAHR